MPRSPSRTRVPNPAVRPDRPSLYAEITNRILVDLDRGTVPWVQPWGAGASAPLGLPRNAATSRAYSGVNVLILWRAVVSGGYPTQGWLTFRQALALGGHVRRGEAGTTVVYADRFTPDEERERAARENGTARGIPFLKRFTVFNAAQCEGLPERVGAEALPVPEGLILPAAEALIRASGADLRLGGDRAYYSLSADYVQVPHPGAFHAPIDWHRTALHELGHWSGAPHRLARDLSGRFGSGAYAREELVAEMTAAFACASLGIVPTVRHADYLGHWIAVLREDARAIVRAASAASKAAEYLLSFPPGRAEVEPTTDEDPGESGGGGATAPEREAA